MNEQKYWIGVASQDHVAKGQEGGFCQLCHGKSYPLKRMKKNDWIVYYSPKKVFKEKTPHQKFTAIGRVVSEQVYQFKMAEGFIPYRRDIEFLAAKEVSIRPLIDELDFISDKKRWGYKFRFGHFEIAKKDFELIALAMGVKT